MGWRSVTFQEVSAKIKAHPDIKDVCLYNQQQDAWKGGNNDERSIPPPCVLWEFVSADCVYLHDIRVYEEHEFRAYLVQESYEDEHTGSAASLAHLDMIEEVANLLHNGTFTHLYNLVFTGYELDEDRTNLTVHVLKFKGRVVDDSYAVANQLPTATPSGQQIVVTANPQIINGYKTQNNIP